MSNKFIKTKHPGSLPILIAVVGIAFIIIMIFLLSAAFVGDRRGAGDTGKMITGEEEGGGSPLCQTVPEPYRNIFSQAGQKFQVQAAFIAGIFYGGEHGNSWPNANGPWASSPVGAQGPFQFMPGTWASNKQDGNGDGIMEVQNLWDSAFGASHLNAMNGAGGNTTDLNALRDAASRYNSGRPWSRGQYIPETAAYVPRVINAYLAFKCEGGDVGPIGPGGWIWPVAKPSGFHDTFQQIDSLHPRPHSGIDIAAAASTPIKAVANGNVTSVLTNPNYPPNKCGFGVVINHGNGLSSSYCHMKQINRTVTDIRTVKQGDIIGWVDSTGHSTGNHLHLGAKLDGRWVNPLNYLP